MLKLGGYINILIAIGHMAGLLWADKMFEVTGIAHEMEKAAQQNPLIPYALTVFAAFFFYLFGLYGLSADNKFRKLPFLKPMIFFIAGVYLFRGIGELIFDYAKQRASQFLETTYSSIAVFVGLLYLIGGLNKWKTKRMT